MTVKQEFLPNYSEPLITWREPRAYSRMTMSKGGWLRVLLALLIPFSFLAVLAYKHHFDEWSILRMVVFAFVVACAIVPGIFGFRIGFVACLKDDYALISTGQWSETRVSYGEIDSCTVRRDSFRGGKFAVLTLVMKEQNTRSAPKRRQIGAPNDVSLERILTILRSKGVNVIEK